MFGINIARLLYCENMVAVFDEMMMMSDLLRTIQTCLVVVLNCLHTKTTIHW